MAQEPKRMKTESLSLRLDPKTKFILDFVARINGQSITTVVERAIKSASENISLGPQWDESGREIDSRNWMSFWDPTEGVRTLLLFADPDYPTNFEEDELRAFTLAHWQFFYTTSSGKEPRRAYVEILWSKIDQYIEVWRSERTRNYWAAGEEMKRDLLSARVAPPEWPPEVKPVIPKETKQRSDLDDEIPF